jgi:hypothetical protein
VSLPMPDLSGEFTVSNERVRPGEW